MKYKPLLFALLFWVISVPLYLYLEMPFWFYPAALIIITALMVAWWHFFSVDGKSEAKAKRVNPYLLLLSGIFAVAIISYAVYAAG